MMSDHEHVPRVSVVMSVWNTAGFLQPCIESILKQTFRDFEFLILDDGSTDETVALLRDAARRDSRIRPVEAEHRGICVSLNELIGRATGEFIALQDGDDVSLPDRLSREVQFLDENPEISLVGTWCAVIDERGERTDTLRWPVKHEDIYARLHRYMPFQHGSLMIRRQVVLDVGGYRPPFTIAGDVDLCMRITERYRVANIPETLFQYRRHGTNATNRKDTVRHEVQIARALSRQREAAGHDVLMTACGPLSLAWTPYPPS